MKSTDYWPRPPRSPATSGSRFRELSGIFRARLCLDGHLLNALTRKLAGPGVDPGTVYQELRILAHRLAGAAMVFEELEIGHAAEALESAAKAAATGVADHSALGEAIGNVLKLLPQAQSPRTRDPPTPGGPR